MERFNQEVERFVHIDENYAEAINILIDIRFF